MREEARWLDRLRRRLTQKLERFKTALYSEISVMVEHLTCESKKAVAVPNEFENNEKSVVVA